MENKKSENVSDIASLANVDCVHQKHIDLNLEVDFENNM